MITTYHRPKTLEEALSLLAQPDTFPLGGGTLLSHPAENPIQVVDLQLLGMNKIEKKGNDLEIGAGVPLESLLQDGECPAALKRSLNLEAPLNIRNAATVAGTIVSSDGRSPFITVLLSLDAKIEMASLQDNEVVFKNTSLGEYLLLRNTSLITRVILPLNTKLAFEFVSRTPSDTPVICAAMSQWGSGRTRLVLGGYGAVPVLAMDGTEADGFEAAARNAYHEATDQWAGAEYRMNTAAVLARRCFENL